MVAAFSPPAPLAIGIILVAATSGGTTSKVMTYLSRGNAALRLVLTVVTALLSMVTLPLWIDWALNPWGSELSGGSYVGVSFRDVAGLLVMIIFIPVGIGMLLRNRKPAVA